MEQNKKPTNFFAKIGGFFKKIEWKKTVNPIVAYSVFGCVCVISLVLFLVFCL